MARPQMKTTLGLVAIVGPVLIAAAIYFLCIPAARNHWSGRCGAARRIRAGFDFAYAGWRA